jgi:S-formylglutathione hydrolase FrmB
LDHCTPLLDHNTIRLFSNRVTLPLLLLAVSVLGVEPAGRVFPAPPMDRVRQAIPLQRSDGLMGSATIYLPPSYHDSPKHRYPVLFLLHGLTGEGFDWISRGHVHARLDEAIAAGRLEPVIAIMPDGQDGYWVDWPDDAPEHRYSSLVEPMATDWADQHFRTDGRRAIAGLSMGGFGALSIAMRTPGRFKAAISLSGALFAKPPAGRGVYLAAFGAPGAAQWRFAFWNPLDLVRMGRADNLAIWLDCGAEDHRKFKGGLHTVSAALSVRGIKHVARLRPGRHEWAVWMAGLEDALPWLQRQLAQEAQGPSLRDNN